MNHRTLETSPHRGEALVLEGGQTVRQALDRLAESCKRQPGGPLCPDEATVHRLIAPSRWPCCGC